MAASGTFFLHDHYTLRDWAFVFSAAQAFPLLVARHPPLTGWFLALVASTVVPNLIVPTEPNQPWPWTPAALIAYLFVQLAVANRWPRWVSIPTWAAVVGASLLVVRSNPAISTDSTQMAILLGAFSGVAPAGNYWRSGPESPASCTTSWPTTCR